MTLPPGPRGLPILGSAWHFLKDMPEFFLELASRGSLTGFMIGPYPSVLVNEPDEIGRILVSEAGNFRKSRGFQRTRRVLGDGLLTSEGAFHLRQRRLAQKAFTKARIDGYVPAMRKSAEELTARWQDGEKRNILDDMTSLALRIAAHTLFSANITGQAAEVGEALDLFLRHFPSLLIPGSELFDWLPHPTITARKKLDKVIYGMIEERRQAPEAGTDLLGLLMSAVDDEGDGGRMSDLQLRDELVTMLLAGHETTANALTFTLYLLALHPEWQDRLHAEARQGGEFPLNRMAFAEGIRLYPPAWTTARKNVEPYTLGKWTLPPGTTFFLSPLVTQRDARFFPNPLAFQPERPAPARMTYFPFGAGTRQCIGERFAWTEGSLILATLMRDWRFAYAENRPPRVQGTVTLRPRDGLPLVLTRR